MYQVGIYVDVCADYFNHTQSARAFNQTDCKERYTLRFVNIYVYERINQIVTLENIYEHYTHEY